MEFAAMGVWGKDISRVVVGIQDSLTSMLHGEGWKRLRGDRLWGRARGSRRGFKEPWEGMGRGAGEQCGSPLLVIGGGVREKYRSWKREPGVEEIGSRGG